MKLRSVELQVKDPATAADFLEKVWGLSATGGQGDARYFRGTAGHAYLVAIRPGDAPLVDSVTFSGSPSELKAIQKRTRTTPAQDEPGFLVQGPHGHVYRFVEDAGIDAQPSDPDKPVQLTHVVLNSPDVPASERFAVETLGFIVSDRTQMMSFVRCNRKHHCIAYARADLASLHHIAFEMRDLDAVMRGVGRLQDAGYPSVWGPGRHGPGNNVFGYFIAPFGAMVEYTAEVEEVDESYRVGAPEDWKWPAGRIDHWGVSKKDAAKTGPAERLFRFPGK
jgi:2,3-dihydroxy-p-cumate/2,3-dihydroxybenzoate 3,4-dioxygenase